MDFSADDYTDVMLFLSALRLVAGERGVRRVQDAHGGTQVHVPAVPTEDGWLSLAIGHKNAVKVCAKLISRDADDNYAVFPRIYIPLGQRSVIAETIRNADRFLLQGLSVRRVAVMVGVSERTIFRRRALLVKQGRLPEKTGNPVMSDG